VPSQNQPGLEERVRFPVIRRSTLLPFPLLVALVSWYYTTDTSLRYPVLFNFVWKVLPEAAVAKRLTPNPCPGTFTRTSRQVGWCDMPLMIPSICERPLWMNIEASAGHAIHDIFSRLSARYYKYSESYQRHRRCPVK